MFYEERSKHHRGSVKFTVIMKELLSGNSCSMKAYIKTVVCMSTVISKHVDLITFVNMTCSGGDIVEVSVQSVQ